MSAKAKPSRAAAGPQPAAIELFNVRVHNLRGIDVAIPLGRFVAVTGVSGSGKSSLAFDTLAAEGQRRYIETFSAYARQFLPRLAKPAVDRVENIPPAVAVAQAAAAGAGSSTAAAAAGLLDYLRIVYARAGVIECPRCRLPVIPATPEGVADRLTRFPAETPVIVAFRVRADTGADLAQALRDFQAEGFMRIAVGDALVRLDEPLPAVPPDQPVRVVIDRVKTGAALPPRLIESVENAFARTGEVHLRVGDHWEVHSARRVCSRCAEVFPDPAPALFRRSNPESACPTCAGKGTLDAGATPCPDCGGAGLRPQVLAYKWNGQDLAEFARQTMAAALDVVSAPAASTPRIEPALDALRRRLGFLVHVGLGYLTLDRTVGTLSTGEERRLALVGAFSTGLARTLFVLDEPTAGLHPRDTQRLIEALHQLRNRGNTVVVVEHDLEVIAAADHVLELGPGAGADGGQVVFAGPPAQLRRAEGSATAKAFARPVLVKVQPRPARGTLRLHGARRNNLKNLDVSIPLGCLVGIAGVSGAGKSSLVVETLVPAVQAALGEKPALVPQCDRLDGAQQLDEVVLVDANAVGRSPRGNPATYLKIFDEIRSSFADTLEARTRGIGSADFSFNLAGGRCERCQGAGVLTVDMQFLPDVKMACPECGGSRYQARILEIKYRGLNIAEVLDLTAREAFGFFRQQPKIQERLQWLTQAGVGYLRLGQGLPTLSGGELQRLKLAASLSGRSNRRSLFVFEEPTTGLHPADVATLLRCFDALLAVGHSLVVIEHDVLLLSQADVLIELGPGAGTAGGEIIAQGTAQELATLPTPTGQLLASAAQRSPAKRQRG